MKFIEVPVFNEDGSITATMQVGPEEAQELLQFAVNFMANIGRRSLQNYVVVTDQDKQEFDD